MSAPCYDFKLKRVPSGNPYRPDRHDPCKICHCSNGTFMFCTTVMCFPPSNCTSFVQRLDECCSFDCKLTSETPRIKLIKIETNETVKQGARFGATALTISLIISIFIFMIMRLKRRQAFINSLRQRSAMPRENLLWFSDNNNNNLDNFDDLSNLRHIIINSRRCDLPRSLPSTSDFSHFLPISSFCLPSSNVSTISGDRRRLHDTEDLSYISPPSDSDNLASFTLYGLDLPAYEKGEDEPPPYDAPPPYMEGCTNGEEIAQAQLIESYTSSRSESMDESNRVTLDPQLSCVDIEISNGVEGSNTYHGPGCSTPFEDESVEMKNPNNSA